MIWSQFIEIKEPKIVMCKQFCRFKTPKNERVALEYSREFDCETHACFLNLIVRAIKVSIANKH